jgi:hypothetical protein
MKSLLPVFLSFPILAFAQGGGTVIGNGETGGGANLSKAQYIRIVSECDITYEEEENNYSLLKRNLKQAGARYDEIHFLISFVQANCL